MRIIVHKNDMKSEIKTPTISIMESEMTSAEEILRKIDRSLMPVIVKEEELPDYSFRRAWDIVEGKVVIDIDKAKEIHRERMRIARNLKFPELDIAYQRSTETNNNKNTKEIISQKQQLRDAPADPRIENCTTVQQLKMVWPDFLGDHYDSSFDPKKANKK